MSAPSSSVRAGACSTSRTRRNTTRSSSTRPPSDRRAALDSALLALGQQRGDLLAAREGALGRGLEGDGGDAEVLLDPAVGPEDALVGRELQPVEVLVVAVDRQGLVLGLAPGEEPARGVEVERARAAAGERGLDAPARA